MQLCFSTLVCPNWTLPQIVGAAAAYGVDGIDLRGISTEIDVTRLTWFGQELPATLELLASHRLVVPCLNTSVTLVTPAAERWEMMLDECRRYAELAGRLGTKFLRIFGGGVPKGMTRGEGVVIAKRHLRQLIKLCGPHGCQVLLETHDDWAGSAQVLELVAEFRADDVAVLWDLEHPARRGESPRETAEALKGYVRHVHIKDSVRQEGKNLPRLLGEGELPLKELIGALRAVGYDRWICLETEKRWHPQDAPEPEQSIPQFVRYMKDVAWRPTAKPGQPEY